MQDLERFLRFGPEVTEGVKEIMLKGAKIWEFFKKDSLKAITIDEQISQVKKILGD